MTNHAFTDRRKRPRVALHWLVHLKATSCQTQIQVETQNLSSEGFYCLSPQQFTPGEMIECLIGLPAPDGSPGSRVLFCRATVLRVESHGASVFGVACHIDDYSLSLGSVQ